MKYDEFYVTTTQKTYIIQNENQHTPRFSNTKISNIGFDSDEFFLLMVFTSPWKQSKSYNKGKYEEIHGILKLSIPHITFLWFI